MAAAGEVGVLTTTTLVGCAACVGAGAAGALVGAAAGGALVGAAAGGALVGAAAGGAETPHALSTPTIVAENASPRTSRRVRIFSPLLFSMLCFSFKRSLVVLDTFRPKRPAGLGFAVSVSKRHQEESWTSS